MSEGAVWTPAFPVVFVVICEVDGFCGLGVFSTAAGVSLKTPAVVESRPSGKELDFVVVFTEEEFLNPLGTIRRTTVKMRIASAIYR
jgi:hypothetical protein